MLFPRISVALGRALSYRCFRQFELLGTRLPNPTYTPPGSRRKSAVRGPPIPSVFFDAKAPARAWVLRPANGTAAFAAQSGGVLPKMGSLTGRPVQKKASGSFPKKVLLFLLTTGPNGGMIRPSTVEEEEYPFQGVAKGAVKSETTAHGRTANGLPRAAAKAFLSGRSCRRDPTPVIQVARMLVRERKPAVAGKLSGTAEIPPQATRTLLGAFFHT